MHRWLGLSVCFLAGGAALAGTPRVGQPAPDFTLKLVDGRQVSSAELRGQVVVLNFWATWCGPCRTELPLLDGYYRALKGNGLRVFAVTTQDSVPLYQLRGLFAAMAIPAVRAIKGPYRVGDAVPTNFVIDRAGIVRLAKPGAFDLDGLNHLLIPLLDEPAPD